MNSALVDLFGDDSDSLDESSSTSCAKLTTTTHGNTSLPPEVEEGNIEYKLKLIDPSPSRFEHLVTQLKWRLQEGNGEAIYQIGVEDNGSLQGLNESDMKKSLETLKQMAQRLEASVTIIRERIIDNSSDPKAEKRKSAEVLVRRVPEFLQFIDLRIAVLGNVECGKSTLISVLCYGEYDNGRGRARLNLFRHLHEIQSGHTSSINYEIMGFSDSGSVVNYGNCRSADEICENASKIITFIDLAGHQKYIKTTVFGLTGYAPDFTMLVVNANNGVVGTTKEHLGFSLALEVPVFVVVNKVDTCSEHVLKQTLHSLELILKSPGVGKVPYVIRSEDDAVEAAKEFAAQSNVCPIFAVSCVEGTNVDALRKFLNVLPPLLLNTHEREKKSGEPTEFRVDEIYHKQRAGNILAGMLVRGSIREHEKLLLGPFEFGEFVPVEVQTTHRHRVPCRIVRAGQSAALSLGRQDVVLLPEKLRKGMVLVSAKAEPRACKQFECEIYLLYHSSQMAKGMQATLHIQNVCQTACITAMSKDAVRTNERATVVWRFKSRPEYVTIGSRLIFREGTTKGIGEVTAIFPLSDDETMHKVHSDASFSPVKKMPKLASSPALVAVSTPSPSPPAPAATESTTPPSTSATAANKENHTATTTMSADDTGEDNKAKVAKKATRRSGSKKRRSKSKEQQQSSATAAK